MQWLCSLFSVYSVHPPTGKAYNTMDVHSQVSPVKIEE
uniref:Uncharacterized protein n=1 Tax=Anguilla anguilla TaxID=7936 RepID=A0A0E9S797_ANGAN